jgi:hypothetical protein
MIEPEQKRKERQLETLRKMRERAEAEGDKVRVKNIEAGIASTETRLQELQQEAAATGTQPDTATRR